MISVKGCLFKKYKINILKKNYFLPFIFTCIPTIASKFTTKVNV